VSTAHVFHQTVQLFEVLADVARFEEPRVRHRTLHPDPPTIDDDRGHARGSLFFCELGDEDHEFLPRSPYRAKKFTTAGGTPHDRIEILPGLSRAVVDHRDPSRQQLGSRSGEHAAAGCYMREHGVHVPSVTGRSSDAGVGCSLEELPVRSLELSGVHIFPSSTGVIRLPMQASPGST